MPTLKGVLQKYHDGQNIFRREAVACLVARIEQLEAHIASQHHAHSDVATVCPKCNYMAKYPVCLRCGTSIPAPQVA